jgi:hypothetical protein
MGERARLRPRLRWLDERDDAMVATLAGNQVKNDAWVRGHPVLLDLFEAV